MRARSFALSVEVGTATVSVSVKMLRTCGVLSGSLLQVNGAVVDPPPTPLAVCGLEVTPSDVPAQFCHAEAQLVGLGNHLGLPWNG